ncbi:MAG: tetratricopeptide repeat protein [Bacteroidota bacterium]
MAQINPPKPLVAPTSDDLREDNLTTAYARSSMFFDQYQTAIVGGGVTLIALVLGFFGWQWWQGERSAEGQQLLGAILTEYEVGNWQTALDGTDTAPGLLEIADQYGSTSTGEQATFFAADAYYNLGQYDEALALFEDYDGEGLLGASALAGQAAIAEQQGDAAGAAALFERAAASFESPASAPGYLLDAARAHVAASDTEAALAALQTVLDDYAETPEAVQAELEMGRATGMATASGAAEGGVVPAPVAEAEATADAEADAEN